MNDKENRDLLVELRTQNVEILRRLVDYDKIIVPRSEYNITISELRNYHVTNQKGIESNQEEIRTLQEDFKSMIWKVGGGLATLQVITSIVLFLLSKA